MKMTTMIAGAATMAAIGLAAGMMSPAHNSRRMRRKVNSAMRAVGSAADSLGGMISDVF
ncbi:MAG: hypothetical protein IJF59_03065 [Clostridia bacterium]|nr:hypothetical protein [Clostridia bacterium]MBQ3076251.1 hypothetical protein [Clostridia bacterium]